MISFFVFCFTYAFSVTMYHSRVFYYSFYLELIKCELLAIENALRDVTSMGDQ